MRRVGLLGVVSVLFRRHDINCTIVAAHPGWRRGSTGRARHGETGANDPSGRTTPCDAAGRPSRADLPRTGRRGAVPRSDERAAYASRHGPLGVSSHAQPPSPDPDAHRRAGPGAVGGRLAMVERNGPSAPRPGSPTEVFYAALKRGSLLRLARRNISPTPLTPAIIRAQPKGSGTAVIVKVPASPSV